MFKFSEESLSRLYECEDDLQEILFATIKLFDFKIITGSRNKIEQERMVTLGRSKVNWPDGAHNCFPSKAVDVAPYPVNWERKTRFFVLAGIILSIAHEKNIKIRWGGDWEGKIFSEDIKESWDLGHFELVM